MQISIGAAAGPSPLHTQFRIFTVCLLALFLAACGGSGSDSEEETAATPCTYPDMAPADFMLNEPIPAFSWPGAADIGGNVDPLNLVDVACDLDAFREWADIDYLFFVSFVEWGPINVDHVREVIGVENQIEAEGIEIIWVLETPADFNPATAQKCREVMNTLGSGTGLCVGDDETGPGFRPFDGSPFAIGRGFDILVRRSDMQILYVTTAGSPGGNENLTGPEVLQEIRDLI